jgi:hypothetical protein
MIEGQVEALDRVIREFISGPLAEEKNDRAVRAKMARQEKKRLRDEEQAEQAAIEAVGDREAKEAKEEAKRLEREEIETRKRIELAKKEEDRAQLAILVRIAGENAERQGIKSIHRGR